MVKTKGTDAVALFPLLRITKAVARNSLLSEVKHDPRSVATRNFYTVLFAPSPCHYGPATWYASHALLQYKVKFEEIYEGRL